MLNAGPAAAQTADEVKAAFLYHFVKFVDWPGKSQSSHAAPIVFGVVGREDFIPILQKTVEGKTVGGRPLRVRPIHSPADLPPCHVVFFASGKGDNAKVGLDALAGAMVLTVGDVDDFTDRGGMIGFFLQDNRIRFEINLDAAARSGIHISSKLLQLARIVREEGGSR